MTCVSPPELDAFQLLTYLDGEAADEVAAHLRACAYCRARAARLQQMEGYAAAAAYRRACRPPEELGEYRLGLLGRKRTADITRHLTECPHCARELAQIEIFLGDLAPALVSEPGVLEGAIERVRVVVAKLLGGTSGPLSARQPALAQAYGGVRGGGGEPAVFEAGGVQVVAGAQREAAAPDRFILLGLITGVDPAGWTAHLWQGGRLIAAVSVDEGGNFTVSDLAPTRYELVLSGPGQEIYIEELTI